MSSKNDKAPGIDGFNAEFYKSCWPIIKYDIIEAILSFFRSGKMLGELNITSITLVAKKRNPNTFQDYRPISVCKVLYRFISKIIAKRLTQVLQDVASLNQHAFIKDRKIHENIALCHELLHNYHQGRGPPRMAIKIDIHKAYDSLNWDFLIHLLYLLGFPPAFLSWIRACITRPHFTINLNGNSVGYFSSTRGLRQGCPVAPYLFIIAMQYFSDLLDQQVARGRLTPHQHCSSPLITHLIFADDLFIFSKADLQSAEAIMQVLSEFAAVSGLQPNPSKSVIFLAGCGNDTQRMITAKLGMLTGQLPIKYLGIPLISKRLSFQDCTPLLEAIALKIQSWQNTSLSYAGRAELIKSVLMGRILYWISSFLLPQKVIHRLNQLLTRFLWSGQDRRGMHKVALQEICQPKKEGGLDLRCIKTLNKACMMRYIWAVVSSKESLWVKWINERYLKENSIWTLHTPYSCSWALRSILQVRSLAINCIRYLIGDGSSTLLWLDPWHPRGVLQLAFGEHIAYEVNPNRMAKVANIRNGDRWHTTHPHSTCLISIWDTLNSIDTLQESEDAIAWTPSQTGNYTLKSAYEQIRTPGNFQSWHSLVWFKGAIPRYSFIAWLLHKGKLTTLDRLRQWGTVQDDMCRLCQQVPETAQHLFFECTYTANVWSAVLQKCSINRTPTGWTDEQIWLNTALAGGQPKDIARKIAFTTTVYHIWAERNNRIFRGTNKPVQSVILAIFAVVRCRLTFLYPQVQDTAENRAILGTWEIQTQYKTKDHTWIKRITPQTGDITLNTDASLCQDWAGLGYILRNDQGDPILAGKIAVTASHSILLHEMQAILRGLITATRQRYSYIKVQSDSKVAIDIINGNASAPWTCWPTLSRIRAIRNKHSIHFSFVHRQANQPADYLSHASHHISAEDTIILPGDFPQQLQNLITRDKQQMAYIRI